MADGVGGWREKGVDPSLFAKALMTSCKSVAAQMQSECNPVTVLQKSHMTVMQDTSVPEGRPPVPGNGRTVCHGYICFFRR